MRRMATNPVALCLQDTTTLDLNGQDYVQRVTVSDDKRGPVEVTCVIAREQDPPEGMKSVEWRLLSNRGVTDLKQATELID